MAIICQACDGEGKRYRERVRYERCDLCRGKGKLSGGTCPNCEGAGGYNHRQEYREKCPDCKGKGGFRG